MSELNKYEEKMATDEGKGSTEGQRDGCERNMRISRKINDAATPSGAQNVALESMRTHTNIQAFSAN